MACALLTLLGSLSAETTVSVSNLFASNMMFQRGIPIKVFGKASAGESVTVALAGNSQTVTADSSGTHTLRIHYREDGFRLDRVAISPTAITTLP